MATIGHHTSAGRQIESLREYALVAQGRPHIDWFTRGDDHLWRLSEATGLDASIELAAVGCRLKLADVYPKVTWAAE